MPEEIESLESPIDTIYLIHKALKVEAESIETMVDNLDTGGSLQPFKLAFNAWATALVYHAEQEERYMAHLLTHSQPASNGRLGENGRARDLKSWEEYPAINDSSEMMESARRAMAAQEEELRQRLVDKVEEVLTVLSEDIGTTSVIARTKQHLYQRVVALRIALEDHQDVEEAFVLPAVRRQMKEQQQLELAKVMLLDQDAQDPRWMIDWIRLRLSFGERALLSEMETRLEYLASCS